MPACTHCPQCNSLGERVATQQDIDRAKQIAATDGLHRSRSFERVAKTDDDDRVYAEKHPTLPAVRCIF